MKNKYAYRSKISEAKIRQIVRLFVVDLDASQIAAATNLNRNTINCCLAAFEGKNRRFGARRAKGVRGRGAHGKTIVFGLLRRNGRGYTESVPGCSKPTLQGMIRDRVELEGVIHSDGWRGYDGW